MILPEVAARINYEFHRGVCVCEGTLDSRCKAVIPAGVSGIAGERTGLMSINTLPEVPAGGISPKAKSGPAATGIALARGA